MLRGGLSFLFLLGALVACSTVEVKAERLCTPNANVFCRCADREEGTKRCNEDGQSFQECVPCDGSGRKPPGSGGVDGLGKSRFEDPGDDDDDRRGKGNDDDEDPGEEEPKAELDGGAPTGPTSEEVPPSKRDAGSSSTAPDENIDFPDEIHCKPLKNVAPRIELQRIADSPTPAVGGKPLPGLYVQAWAVEFTGEDGETGPAKKYSRQTIEIAEDVGRYVFEEDDGRKFTGGFRLTPKGKNRVEVAYECPAAPPRELEYDATDWTLILYDPPYARVFVRQEEGR